MSTSDSPNSSLLTATTRTGLKPSDYTLMKHHAHHQGDEEVGGVGTHAERHFESPRIISDIIIGFRQVFT